jgi:hypothetical protein
MSSVDDVDEAIQTIVERVGAMSVGTRAGEEKFQRLSETAKKLQTKVQIDPQVTATKYSINLECSNPPPPFRSCRPRFGLSAQFNARDDLRPKP